MDLGTFFDYPEEGDGAEPAVVPAGADAPFLADCSEDEWELIRAHAERVRYPAGSVLIEAGAVDRAVIILSSGIVDLIERRRRRERTVGSVGVGACIGEISFLDGLPATVEARARTDVDALRLTLPRFEVLAAKAPAFATFVVFDLGRVVAGRLRNAQALLQR